MVAGRNGLITLVAKAIIAVPSRADLRIKVTETSVAGTSIRTEYFKGDRWRRDSEPAGGWLIVDSANKRSIAVDASRHEYSVNTFASRGQTLDADETIVVEIETRDTGEQSQKFGHRVRHLITTEHRHSEYLQKPASETRKIVTDGWYLDFPLLFPNHSRIGAVAVLSILDAKGRLKGVPKVQVTRHGPVPRGLAVSEKGGDYQLELTEFSEAPLNDDVFEPPAGFRRVVRPFPGERLSLADELLLGWQQFQDWLASF
jgi:hypothetical protein